MAEGENGNSDKLHRDREEAFEKFLSGLLRAQQHDFVKARDLFSHEELTRILTRFCNIIADDLDAESCVVHLQMYDPQSPEARYLFDKVQHPRILNKRKLPIDSREARSTLDE